MKKFFAAILLFTFAQTSFVKAKNYKGAEYRTKAAFTYGRFEVRMKPAHRSGIVSSFFTYHEISNLSEWNEIDIENIGRYDDQIQFNTITPNQTNHVRNQVTGFNPYEDFHTYAFEWTPFYVAWFIDGNEVYRQTDSHIGTLTRAQKIMMNIWPSEFENWVGEFDPNSLPTFAYYDWVKYYEYTPGTGNYGTDDNFTLSWTDDFNFFDTSRWQKATHTFSGNLCDFTPDNALFQDGKLILCLTDDTHLGYQDNSAPFVKWASGFGDGKIKVQFSEELDQTTAENISNYFITSGNVTAAELSGDKTSVILTTNGYNPFEAANIIVQNVVDLFGNPISVAAKSVMPTNYLGVPAKINVAGNSVYGYLEDYDWSVDKSYGHVSGSIKMWNSVNIQGTTEDLVYQNDMEGLTKYQIRVPNGNYKVTFMFAEKFWDNPNQRVFDVYLENQLKINNLDIVDSVGKNTALDITVNTSVNDELLDIVFSPEKDLAILSGIKIEEGPNSVGEIEKVKSFRLGQNYPNPFNPTTKINFTIPPSGNDVYCKLTIFDSLGRVVENLIDNYKNPGNYTLSFNGSQLSSGIYFYRLSAGDFSATKKMLLLK
jgi:hypothetical protein